MALYISYQKLKKLKSLHVSREGFLFLTILPSRSLPRSKRALLGLFKSLLNFKQAHRLMVDGNSNNSGFVMILSREYRGLLPGSNAV